MIWADHTEGPAEHSEGPGDMMLLRQLREQLHKHKEHNEQLERQVKALQESNQRQALLEEEQRALQSKLTRLQGENERLQHVDAERYEAQTDARQWVAVLGNLGTAAEIASQIRELQAGAAVHECELSALQTQAKLKEGRLEELEGQLAHATGETKRLKLSVVQLEAELSRSQQAHAVKSTQVASLKSLVSSYHDSGVVSAESLDSAWEKAWLSVAKTAAEKQVLSREEGDTALLDQIKQYITKVSDLETTITNLKGKLAK